MVGDHHPRPARSDRCRCRAWSPSSGAPPARPAATSVRPPPPSAPVDAWKSILCSMTLFGVLQRELDIVALVADHQRSGDRPVEGRGVDLGAVVVDHPLLLRGDQLDLDDLRTARVVLVVVGREGRGDERLLDPLHAAHLGLYRGFALGRHHDRTHGRHGAQGAAGPQKLASVQLKHGSCLLSAFASRPESVGPDANRRCKGRIRRSAGGEPKDVS